MKSFLMAGVAAVGMMMTSLAAEAQTSYYTVTTVDVPGATDTALDGINDAGQIVGYATGPSGAEYGFLDTNGSFARVNDGTLWTQLNGINSAGKAVGWNELNSGWDNGVIDVGGTFTSLAVPGALSVTGYGINDAGQIVGTFYNGSATRGFLETNGTFATISVPGSTYTVANGISDSGVISGWYISGSAYHAFIDTNGTYTTIDPPGATEAVARAINSLGQVLVTSSAGLFIEADGGYTAISPNVPGATQVYNGINDAGVIVGFYQTSNGTMNGFVATPNGTTTDSVPLPVAGGTAPGGMLILGWLGRQIIRRRKA